MAKKQDEPKSNKANEDSTRKFNTEQRVERNSAKEFAKEYADLLRDQNQELGTQKAIQTEITSRLQELRKNTTGHNVEIGASISLSKAITKSLEDSISAGKSINQLENSKNKIKTQGSLIDLQMGALAKDSGSTVDELLGKAQERNNLQKELTLEAAIYQDHLDKVKSVEEQILQSTQNTEESKRNIFYLEGEIEGLSGKELEAKQKILGEEVKKLKTLEQIDISNINDLNTSISKQKLAETDLKTAEEKFKNLEEQLTVEEKQAIELVKSRDTLKEADLTLQKQLDKQNAINSALGLSGQGIAAFNKLLGGALGSTSEIESESRRIVEQKIEEGTLQNSINGKLDEAGNVIEGNVSKMQGFGIQLGQIGKSIGKNMMDPIALIGAALDFSDKTTKLQKSLAISRGEANDMVADFEIMAKTGGDLAITGTRIASAFSTLSDQIGTTSKSLMGMSADAAVLSEKLGVSAEGVGNAGKASLLMGRSIKNIKLDIIQSTTNIRQQTGIALDYNKVLKATLNVSGQIRAQMQGNPKLIAEAVAQAQALGMELEQVAKVGNSLLNFEQSIESELEAELLTGKQLNLEKARLLALTGDYKELSKEIAKQAGSFTDFSKMNVLQQNALAKSFGMSSDEMADMLMDQESLGKTSEQLRAEGKKELAQRMEARTLQEDFNDAVLQLKELFVSIMGGPLQEILKGLGEGIGDLMNWIAPLVTIAIEIGKGATQLVGWLNSFGLLSFLIKPVIVLLASMWVVNKVSSYFKIAKAGFSTLKGSIKSIGKGLGGLMDKFKGLGKGAKGIKFDPKMAGGGRFKDIKSGKMVSEAKANKAGVFKPKSLAKTKDISKDVASSKKGGATTGGSSKGTGSGLKELAKGLKAMGDGKVLKGILAIALAGPAFIVALPSIPFLLFMGLTPLGKLKSNFTDLAKGLKAMGGGKVISGSLALGVFGVSAAASLISIPFLTFMGLTPLKQLGPNLRSLAIGLKALGGGKQLFGVGVIAGLGVAGALAVIAIPFLGFIGLFGVGVASGLVALGGGLASLGAVAASGVPFIAVGLIAALGVSLIPFGVALMAAGKGMEYFGKGIKSALEPVPPIIEALAAAFVSVLGAFGDFVMQISELPMSKLLMMGPALAGLGVGMGALGIALLIAAPGLIILKMFGVPALMSLGAMAPKLDTAAEAFKKLAAQSLGILQASISIVALGVTLLAFSLMALPSLLVIPILSGVLLILTPILYAAGGAMQIFGEGVATFLSPLPPIIEAAAAAFKTIVSSIGSFFTQLSKLDPKQLIMLGPAFVSMGAGLAALGGGALLAAPGLWLLGKRIHIFKKLAKVAEPLKDIAAAIKSLASNIKNVKGVGYALKGLAKSIRSLGGAAVLGAVFIPPLAAALGLLAPVLKLVGEAAIIFGKGLKAALEPIPPVLDAIASAVDRIMRSFGDFFITLGTLNPLQLIALGPAFASMGLGLTALGIGALIAAPGLWLLEQRMPLFKNMGDVAPNLERASKAVDSLGKNVSKMKTIGKGFAHMGKGLRSLAFGLMMIAPFLPVLRKVSKMTHTLGGGESHTGGSGGDSISTKNEKIALDDNTMRKLATMVATAVSKVKINGEVKSDLWGSGNRNADGDYASSVQNATQLA